MRYICKKWNSDLLGKTDKDFGRVEMLVGVIRTILQYCVNHCYGSGDKQALLKDFNSSIPQVVAFLGNNKFLVGDYVTYVDFIFYELLELVSFVSEGKVYTENPTLDSFKKSVESLEKMAKHLQSERFVKGTFNNKVAKINN